MSCAQCHDHKFDPISMKDYYGMLDMFNRVPETGKPGRQSSFIQVAAPFLILPPQYDQEALKKKAKFESEIATLQKTVDTAHNFAYMGWKAGIVADGNSFDIKGLPNNLQTILKKPEKKQTKDEKKKLADGLRKYFREKVQSKFKGQIPEVDRLAGKRKDFGNFKGDHTPRPMIMSDDKPRESHVLHRGQYLQPGEKVSFQTPAFLPAMYEDLRRNVLVLHNGWCPRIIR